MAYTLFRYELYTIVSNKRYMLSLALQLLVLFAILPVFSTFLSTGGISIFTPALEEFIPLGVVDGSRNSQGLWDALEANKKIELVMLGDDYKSALESGAVAGVLIIPSDYDESLNKVLEVELITDASNLKAGAVYDAIYPSIVEASVPLTQRRIEAFGVAVEERIKIEKHLLKPAVIQEGDAKFSSFFLTYLIPIMLFFPLFTVGSIILDSVVGDREKKTVESLLVSPIKRRDVVFSKFLSVSFFVLMQLIIWLSFFKWYGVPVKNNPLILFMILVIDSAVISSALVLAYYSRTVKEANILLMLLYTGVFITLIVSLSINYFDRSLFSTPFSIVSNLVAGERPSLLPWSAALLFYTGLALSVNTRLVERDDIIFGPRPDLYTLFADLSVWLFSFGRAGYIYLTLVYGVFAILYSTFIEVWVGIFVVFAFGFNILLVPLFAFIEEAAKPAGVYLLASKKSLSNKEAVLLGALSGVMFFALESLVFAVATYYLFPTRVLAILKLRIATTMPIHAVASGIVGYGIMKKKSFPLFLLLATLIHTLFNLVVTGGFL